MKGTKVAMRLVGALVVASAVLAAVPAAAGDDHLVLPPLKTVSQIASTVPGNGDVNPYGMAQVRHTVGNLRAGNILISNFNNSQNLQGTGSTVMEVAPDGTISQFAIIDPSALPAGGCPGGVGLTTALVVLDQGWVVVGSLPTSDGTSATAQAGCLIVLDSMGNPVETFFGSLINGPWDMTALNGDQQAKLFVTNVLNGTVAAGGQVVPGGTVVRLDLKVSSSAMPVLESITVIGSGFSERTDPAALVIGPTGVALHTNCAGDADDCGWRANDDDGAQLYVADSLNNRITVIDHPLHRTDSAGTGRVLTAGGSLNDPLGLVVTASGELLTVNGDDGNIIEITPEGRQAAKHLIDSLVDSPGSPPGSGNLFGLAYDPAHGVYFVDDGTNTVNLLH